jgi:hypothetical protein
MDGRVCEAAGCDRPLYAKGLCGKHYKQVLRHGEVRPDRAKVECAVPGCGRPAAARGWCHGHYLRWTRTGDVQPDRPLVRASPGVCEVVGCERRAVSHRLCEAHRQRKRLTGALAPDVPVADVPGTGFTHRGYRHVPVPAAERWLVGGASSSLEHRLVMARLLGRPLRRDESVHHRNGDRADNRPSNLELWSRYQPNGARVEDKVAWALDVLHLYRPDLLAHAATPDHCCDRASLSVAPTRFELAPPP